MSSCVFSSTDDVIEIGLRLEEKIELAIEETLQSNGYELVQVSVVKGKRFVVGVDIERQDLQPVSVDDCVKANQLVSAILDVEDLINGSYNLEVSSPGENRPLKKIKDFQRFCGSIAKVELLSLIDGKSKFTGKLKEVEENSERVAIELNDTGNIVYIPLNNIKKAIAKIEF